MQHKRLLLLVMILIGSICLYLWLCMTGDIKDLGLNALTETAGILITIVVVDYLLKRQEELRSLPQKATAYEDVRLLTTRMINSWAEMYKSSVPEESPLSCEILFSKESFEKMGRYLNLDAKPNVTPSRTWWQWIPQCLSEHIKMAETILERHNNVLDPDAYAFVHQIATDFMKPDLINTIRQSDSQMGIPRPHILSNYYFFSEDYCKAVIGLVDWCERQFKKLEANGVAGLKSVGKKIGPWEKQDQPPSMIEEQELYRQLTALKEFQEAKKI